MKYKILIIFLICFMTGLGATDKTLLFGMSGAFTGHFGMYGNLIKNGIVTAFRACNDQGGANGYKLELCAMEDESNAEITKKNIESMQHAYYICISSRKQCTDTTKTLVGQS